MGLHWVVPLSSNSDHQDCFMFSRGFQPKPSFATITGKFTQLVKFHVTNMYPLQRFPPKLDVRLQFHLWENSMSNNKENQQFNSQLFNTRKFACRLLSTSRGSVQTGSLQNDCSLKSFYWIFHCSGQIAIFLRHRKPPKVREFTIWVCPKIGVNPQNGWFISWKNPLNWMIWGETRHFLEITHIDFRLLWSSFRGRFYIINESLLWKHFDLRVLEDVDFIGRGSFSTPCICY